MTMPPKQPSPSNGATPSSAPGAESAAGTTPAPAPTTGTTAAGRTQRRSDGPRRIKNGVRFRRKEGTDNLPWPASAWASTVLGRMSAECLNEALDYARAGQAASITISAGCVEAVVQGRAPRPYRVRIQISQLSQAEWDRAVATMAAEAIWSAKLLSGELPQSIEILFRGLGTVLVHERDDQFSHACTCAQSAECPGEPCKHIGVAWLLTLERIESDPLLSFTLRGLDGQRVLERLQEARTIATRGVSRAHSTPPAVESASSVAPVERCLQDFWKPGRRFAEIEQVPPEEHVPHAILRRLGPSPFQPNANRASHIQAAPAKGQAPMPPAPTNQPTSKFPLVGLLASIYDSVAAASRKLADAVTRDPANGDSDTASK